MSLYQPLTMDQVGEIIDSIEYRRSRFDEPMSTSLKVVLLNWGNGEKEVRCIDGTWAGRKRDLRQWNLEPRNGPPLCPDNHPLLEIGPDYRLGIVADYSSMPEGSV